MCSPFMHNVLLMCTPFLQNVLLKCELFFCTTPVIAEEEEACTSNGSGIGSTFIPIDIAHLIGSALFSATTLSVVPFAANASATAPSTASCGAEHTTRGDDGPD